MSVSAPSVLYKYRSINPLSLDALAKGRIWYSKPRGLNDPNDVAARWDKNFSAKEILEDYVMKRENGSPVQGIAKYIQSLLDKGQSHEKVLRHIDKIFMPVDKKPQRELLQDVLYYNEVLFSSMGILSLSELPSNHLMWAHYAESHRGFCLGFENHETNIIGQHGYPVRYVEKMPKPNIASFAMDAGGEVVELIGYTKSLDWAYEKEWRVIKQTGDELYPYPGRLVEVILGLNISNEAEQQVRDAVKQSGYPAKFKKIKKPTDDFGLVVADS
ncbi:DUF2971 domain-containing protein [Paraburkholderia sp. DD10]|uniref:DUF2971 domain-containing protein n=1 Tax=Paraburkholderia sp. DD10 TaxID=3409691 RepID=UPI003BA1BDB5